MLQKIRLQKGWSQEELATVSGISSRTIQRIEGGQKPSLETLKALGAAFNMDLTSLKEDSMTNQDTLTPQEISAFKYVKRLRGFYTHAMIFAAVISALIIFAYARAYYFDRPVRHFIYIWALFGWGIGLTAHGFSVFGSSRFFGPEWEKREVEKYLGRKL